MRNQKNRMRSSAIECNRVQSTAIDCNRKKRGFTLIEILLAVVILGTVLTGLMQAFSQNLGAFMLSRRVHALQEVMDLGNLEYPFKFTNDPVTELDVPSDSSFKDGYTYERWCEEPEDELEDLYLVTTLVKFGSGGGGNELRVERYVYFKK